MENEGIWIKEPANYIVKIRRGGRVSHVWELEDAVIKFNEVAKGWEIYTNKKASVFVQGDVEIWRIDQKPFKPAPPPPQAPKKDPFKIQLRKPAPPPPPPPPPRTVREIYEKIYKVLDIRSRLFPDKSELENES